MSNFMSVIDWLRSIFYGEHWYIAWGIILLLLSFWLIADLPKLIKSIKKSKGK